MINNGHSDRIKSDTETGVKLKGNPPGLRKTSLQYY